jgi:hypothetical protein
LEIRKDTVQFVCIWRLYMARVLRMSCAQQACLRLRLSPSVREERAARRWLPLATVTDIPTWVRWQSVGAQRTSRDNCARSHNRREEAKGKAATLPSQVTGISAVLCGGEGTADRTTVLCAGRRHFVTHPFTPGNPGNPFQKEGND